MKHKQRPEEDNRNRPPSVIIHLITEEEAAEVLAMVMLIREVVERQHGEQHGAQHSAWRN